MIKMQYEFVKFAASGIQRPKGQFVFALFEAHAELLPFVSIFNTIATTYHWF